MLLRVLPYGLFVLHLALLLMRAQTKKLTTAAVCTAIAVIMCACTAYLPFSFMPLYIAAFSIFLACKRGSLVYGALCALASIGIMFAMTGLSVSWFLLLFMFAPYGIITYFLHKLTYFKLKSGILRGVIAAAFFNLATGLTYIVAIKAVIGLDIPVTDWVNALGGYWVLAIVSTLVLVPLDFIFSALGAVVLKKIPPAERKKPIKSGERTADSADNSCADGVDKKSNEGQAEYDIFGYEIKRTDETSNDDGKNNQDN